MCAALLLGTALGVAGERSPEIKAPDHSRHVYCGGRIVEINFVPGRSRFSVGPWNISAEILHDRPRDGHPNLYIVAPGTQYSELGAEQYSHNEVVNYVPRKPGPQDWDVYYAVVLDPSLHEDFRSEQQLIVATQDDFQPSANFKFDDIPGAVFLREYLGIDSIQGLDFYSRSEGKLPRLVIIPAKLSLKANAVDPNNPSEQKLSGTLPATARTSVLPH